MKWILGAFKRTNLKSKKVKVFLFFYSCLVGGAVIGALLYNFGFNSKNELAMIMYEKAINYLVASLLLFFFFLGLRWQILRTGILGVVLLSLAHIFCSVLLLLNLENGYHSIWLIGIGVLFLFIFIQQSNLKIYFYDMAHADIFFELLILFGFVWFIGNMLFQSV